LPWLLGIGVAILTAAFIMTVVSRSGSDDADEAVVAAKSAEEADDGKAGAGADDEDETAADDDDEDDGADEDGVAPSDDDGAKAAGDDDDDVGTAEAATDDGADDTSPVADDGDGIAADDAVDPAVDDTAAGDVEPGGASGDLETGYRRVWIDSRPVGAKVFLLPDMTPMGASPLGVDVAEEAESVWFRVVKKGYRTKDVLVRRSEDKVTAKLDKAGKKRPGASVSPPTTAAAIPKTKPKPKTAKGGTLKTPEWMRKK